MKIQTLTLLIVTLVIVETCLIRSAIAKELFICLTLENGNYTLNYFEANSSSSWKSIAVPRQLKSIEDFDYNFLTKRIYLTTSQPLETKGIWDASFPANSLDFGSMPSHKMSRPASKPQTLLIYPDFDVMFIYDAGYDSVLAMNISENVQLYTKVYFQEVENVGPNFFLDTVSNKLVAFGQKPTKTIYQTVLKEASAKPVGNLSTSALLAYDRYYSMIFYCDINGFIGAVQLTNETEIAVTFSTNLTCDSSSTKLVVDNGHIFNFNTTSGAISKFIYKIVNDSIKITSGPIEFGAEKIPNLTKVISFKRYEFNESQTIPKCRIGTCQHLCVPDDKTNEPTCICSDFSSPAAIKGQCASNLVTEPAVVVLESVVNNPNETSILWLSGDPHQWTKRPTRERAMRVNSRVLAMTADFHEHRTYAVEHRLRQIFEFFTNGSRVKMTLYNQLSPAIKTIAYDWIGGNIIWYDPAFQWLRIIPPKSKDKTMKIAYKTAVIMPNLEGYSLALDASAGCIFFLDLEDAESKVWLVRSFTDGSNGTRLTPFNTSYYDEDIDDNNPNHPLPGALAVDPYQQKVWVAFVNHIFVLNYNGIIDFETKITFDGFAITDSHVASIGILNSTSVMIVLSNFVNKTSSMFVYSVVANSLGKCCQEINLLKVRQIYGEFRGLHIYQPPPPPPPSSVAVNCSALNCPNMCVNVNGKATCICPDGYTFNSTSNSCASDLSKPALPVMVYAKGTNLCYRPIDSAVNGPTISEQDNEFCSPTDEFQYQKIAADHFSNAIFAQRSPVKKDAASLTTIHHQKLKAYHSTDAVTLDDSVQIGPKLHYKTSITTMVFDDLARNLYIADVTAGTLIVVHSGDSSYPITLLENVQITAMTIDILRRTLYWAQHSLPKSETQIFQVDLKGETRCQIATVNAYVLQMQFSYASNKLIFLHFPTGTANATLGAIDIDVKKYSPFKNNTCSTLNTTFYSIDPSMKNVEQFAVYQQQLLLAGRLDDKKGVVYMTHNMAQSPTQTQLHIELDKTSRDFSETFTVLNPFLSSLIDQNGTAPDEYDKCGSQDGGNCEYLCLANKCRCPPGMYLLADEQYCRPRYFDFSKGAIFATDEYHHKIFALPLLNNTIQTSNRELSESNLLSFKIHSKAQPQAIAYRPSDGTIYYSDAERRAIRKILPNNRQETAMVENEKLIFPDVEVGGMLIDPATDCLIVTLQNQHKVVSLNLRENDLKTLIPQNDSLNFFAIAKDNRNWLYATVTTRDSALSLYRFTTDGKNAALFEVVPAADKKTTTSFAELAIDYQNDLIYISVEGSILTKNLTNLTEKAKTFLSVGHTNGTDTVHRGIYVLNDGLLLANDWNSGGIEVFRLDTKEKVNVIGKNLFYGLGGLTVFDPDMQTRFTTTKPSASSSTKKTTLPSSSSTASTGDSTTRSSSKAKTTAITSTTSSTGNSTTRSSSKEKTTVIASTTISNLQTTVNETVMAKAAESGFDKFAIVLGTILGVAAAIAIVIGVVFYWRRMRPRVQGFQRLEGSTGYFRMDDEEAISNGLSPGAVAFRNPMFGIDEFDDPDSTTPTSPQQRAGSSSRTNNNGLDMFADDGDGGL